MELTVLSFIKNRKIQILKNTPVERWLHDNQIKGIESHFMPTLPDSIGLLNQGIKKGMANETDISQNSLNLRQN